MSEKEPLVQCDRCKRYIPESTSFKGWTPHGAERVPMCQDDNDCFRRAMPALENEVFAALVKEIIRTGNRWLALYIAQEFADCAMVIDHCSKAYYELSFGRISQVNTKPEEVVTQNEDHWNAICREREEEERAACYNDLTAIVDEIKHFAPGTALDALAESIQEQFRAGIERRTRAPFPKPK